MPADAPPLRVLVILSSPLSGIWDTLGGRLRVLEVVRPRGCKYPMFGLSGSKIHSLDGFWSQKP